MILHRSVRFGALALLVALLCVDVLGLAGAGDVRSSGVRVSPAAQAQWARLDAGAIEFVRQEYATVTAEIRARLDYEQSLFVLKFTLVGGTLYLLFQHASRNRALHLQRTQLTSLIAWAAVVVAALDDLRLMTNQSFLITLGEWVRRYEELQLGSFGSELGWESYLADRLLSQPFYPALRINTQILTGLLFCLTGGLFFFSPPDVRVRTVAVNRIGAVASIGIMTLASISLRREPAAQLTYTALGACAIALAWILAGAPRTPDSPAR